MNVKDLFSSHAADYSAFRPDYPSDLFEFIFNHTLNFNSAWDCGTGNGQAAKVLATRFKHVSATDISNKQIQNAYRENNIQYLITPAEKTEFKDAQFDLITVAQAIHWFKFNEFYREVKRVGAKNSLLAVWGYGLLSINNQFDSSLAKFYKEVVGTYWDAERKFIDEHYKTIPFPFQEIKALEFQFTKHWSLNQLSGYLTTWSDVQKFINSNGYNPVNDFMKSVQSSLSLETNEIRFPLFLRIGLINSLK